MIIESIPKVLLERNPDLPAIHAAIEEVQSSPAGYQETVENWADPCC